MTRRMTALRLCGWLPQACREVHKLQCSLQAKSRPKIETVISCCTLVENVLIAPFAMHKSCFKQTDQWEGLPTADMNRPVTINTDNTQYSLLCAQGARMFLMNKLNVDAKSFMPSSQAYVFKAEIHNRLLIVQMYGASWPQCIPNKNPNPFSCQKP